jgi:hypothetical protein
MTRAKGLSRNQRRQIHRMHRKMREAIRKAENRVNTRIIARMRELDKDDDFRRVCDAEMQDMRSAEDINNYIQRVLNSNKK